MSTGMGNWMHKSTLGVTLLAVVVSFSMLGCVASGSKLAAQRDQIKDQASQIEERAYRCAPKELALAVSHAEFGSTEMSNGNGRRAKDHIEFADNYIKEADSKSLHILCQDPTKIDRDH